MELTTTHALKEWAVAVDALAQGKMIMLLRKGGIKEEGNSFQVVHDQILLYPTYEHQQPCLLKPEYATQVNSVTSGWHPETVQISSWAKITNILQVSDVLTVTKLLHYHIWNEQFVSERFNWKPRQPLYIILLRIYRLPAAVIIPYRQEYGGCRSWIDLVEPISIEGIVPVLDNAQYTQQMMEICQIVDELEHSC